MKRLRVVRNTTGALCAALVALATPALAETISFSDPSGDDKGPGTYTYPTDPVYKRGSFDLTGVELREVGDSVEVKITFATKVEDPWTSEKWDGNGFSLQYAVVHIDTDGAKGSGHEDALPGFNVKFAESSRWNKALIISPQGSRRLASEINDKAKAMKDDIVIPTTVRVRGKSIVARFPKKDVGTLSPKWGYQVLVQSNEGFPDKGDLLTRKVNEYNGPHRFGGGSDFDCDPHVIDMLAGEAKGADSERQAQYDQLGTFVCKEDDPEGGKQAIIGMIYPGGR